MKNKIIYFATKALVVKDGKFLAVHKTGVDHDLYELPGGRLEYGETPQQTLAREMMEETNLVVEPKRILDTWTYINENYQIVGIIYLCIIKDGELKLSDEHDKYEWLPLNKESVKFMNILFSEPMEKWEFDSLRDSN